MTITGGQVLEFLLPEGGWIISGNDYEGITFVSCKPISKAQFEAGFLEYDAWVAERDANKATLKAALLDRLGITADEAVLLLS